LIEQEFCDAVRTKLWEDNFQNDAQLNPDIVLKKFSGGARWGAVRNPPLRTVARKPQEGDRGIEADDAGPKDEMRESDLGYSRLISRRERGERTIVLWGEGNPSAQEAPQKLPLGTFPF
jgi:hypothetical protein